MPRPDSGQTILSSIQKKVLIPDFIDDENCSRSHPKYWLLVFDSKPTKLTTCRLACSFCDYFCSCNFGAFRLQSCNQCSSLLLLHSETSMWQNSHEKVTPIRIETFQYRIKVISYNDIVYICSDLSLKRDGWNQTTPAKCNIQHNRTTF